MLCARFAYQALKRHRLLTARENLSTLLEQPGHPSLYDYEMVPATLPFPPELIAAREHAANAAFLSAEHHTIWGFDRTLQPDSAREISELYEAQGKRYIGIGSQYPPTFWQPVASFDPANEVYAFLDDVHKQHGDKSAVVISFGTLFFPVMKPWCVACPIAESCDAEESHRMSDVLVDSLLAAKLPFIFNFSAALFAFLRRRSALC
jgi:hypothetical protein